jgi:hypothetical protein
MIRLTVNGVSFYTTKSRIVSRSIGSDSTMNMAVATLFENMHNAIGISSRMHVYDGKMNRVSYDIQINRD